VRRGVWTGSSDQVDSSVGFGNSNQEEVYFVKPPSKQVLKGGETKSQIPVISQHTRGEQVELAGVIRESSGLSDSRKSTSEERVRQVLYSGHKTLKRRKPERVKASEKTQEKGK